MLYNDCSWFKFSKTGPEGELENEQPVLLCYTVSIYQVWGSANYDVVMTEGVSGLRRARSVSLHIRSVPKPLNDCINELSPVSRVFSRVILRVSQGVSRLHVNLENPFYLEETNKLINSVKKIPLNRSVKNNLFQSTEENVWSLTTVTRLLGWCEGY